MSVYGLYDLKYHIVVGCFDGSVYYLKRLDNYYNFFKYLYLIKINNLKYKVIHVIRLSN